MNAAPPQPSLRVLYRVPADPDTDWDVVEQPPGAFVAQLKVAIIARLQLTTPPPRVKLALEATAGTMLDGSLTLEEAGIPDGARVLVTVAPVAEPQAAGGAGECFVSYGRLPYCPPNTVPAA